MKKQRKVISRPGEDALWTWFGLSYASWLTLPRVLMHAMPDRWQLKMAALLREYERRFWNQPDIGTVVCVKDRKTNRYITTPSWLIQYRHPNMTEINKLKGKELAIETTNTIRCVQYCHWCTKRKVSTGKKILYCRKWKQQIGLGLNGFACRYYAKQSSVKE